MIKIKHKALEKEINLLIDEMKSSPWQDYSVFTIHIEDDVEIQIRATRDFMEKCEGIYTPYLEAKG